MYLLEALVLGVFVGVPLAYLLYTFVTIAVWAQKAYTGQRDAALVRRRLRLLGPTHAYFAFAALFFVVPLLLGRSCPSVSCEQHARGLLDLFAITLPLQYLFALVSALALAKVAIRAERRRVSGAVAPMGVRTIILYAAVNVLVIAVTVTTIWGAVGL